MITLYDFATKLPGKALSPAVWKVRLALNYKAIPHKTVFIPWSSIASFCKTHNLPLNDANHPSAPSPYTVPIIHDATTNRTIVDSTRIIAYLDGAYPASPPLLRGGGVTEEGALVMAAALDSVIRMRVLMGPLYALIACRTPGVLTDEAGKEIYSQRVFKRLGITPTEFLSDPAKEAEAWTNLEGSFNALNELVESAQRVRSDPEKVGKETAFLGGERMGYADVAVGGVLFWIVRMLGEEHEGWAKVCAWNGGRWGRLYERYKEFAEIH